MGERKRRLAAQPVGQRQSDKKTVARAFEALEAGDRARAEAGFETLLASLPSDSETLNAIGVLGLQIGDPQRALGPLVRAMDSSPRDPSIRCHLAIAYRSLGKPELAVAELETALALDPTLAEAHSNLGNLLLERGDHAAAEASFMRALAISRDYPFALFGLGEAKLAQGREEEACADFERALVLDPSFHEARYDLSRARSALVAKLERDGAAATSPVVVANADSALESIVAAVQLSRENPAYWTQFEHCIKEFDLQHPVDSRVRDLLFRALAQSAVDPARLVRPIVSLIATRPDGTDLRARLAGARDAADWASALPAVRSVLGDALLQRLLEAVLVPSLFIERLLAVARAALLREISGVIEAMFPSSSPDLREHGFDHAPSAAPSGMLKPMFPASSSDPREHGFEHVSSSVRSSPEPALPLPAIVAMAHQCFITEYVYEEADDQKRQVALLREAIAAASASGTVVPLHWYAVYACHRPLHTLDQPGAVAAVLAPTLLSTLASRQIAEPLEERRLRGTIAALTEVVDEVSAAVQSQYEANPYPRWLRIERDVAQTSVARFLRNQFPEAYFSGLPDGPARILVAGCGTGRHPIGTARRFPDSSVLAVDLSLTSLAYAQRKTRELGIGNIEYRQADLLALGALTERFDVIDCTGVLHHLEDPVAGFRILRSLLRPGGVMRVGLYSEFARRHVVRAREFIAEHGFAQTPEGIRACRAAIIARQDDPLLARVAMGEDFYSMSGCRDLIFHVQEHRFTLPRIASVLAELDLDFVGFEWPDDDAPARYRARFPDDRALSDLARWHAFESTRPDTFVLMYQFWVRV